MPHEIAILTAFEDALKRLDLTDRDDPIALSLAKLIVELAKQGERDPARLRARALETLSQEGV